MAIESQSAAVQLALRQKCAIASKIMQRFSQNAQVILADQAVDIDLALTALSNALTAASVSATSVVVANGGTVNVENSAGALDSDATAVVAAGVLTSVKLAATKTILTNALKFSGVTVTGSGTFFTPTIANGVLTGGVLSAS